MALVQSRVLSLPAASRYISPRVMALDMAGDELDDCPASSVMSLDIGRESRNANGNFKKCQYLTF